MSNVDPLTASMVWNKSDEEAVRQGCYFDLAAAQFVENFFRTFLRHSIAPFAGLPFELLEWQRKKIIYPIFGWKKPTGYRRFNRTYVEIPKKNGKSTLAAGVGLYLAFADGEAGAEVYSAATDKNQAKIVHGEAVKMVKASRELAKSLKINKTTSCITSEEWNSKYLALAEGTENKEGFNIHGLIMDELHVWKGRAFWDTLTFGGASRMQSLFFAITTAGSDVNSICKEQHDYVKNIHNGVITDVNYYGYIAAADRKDDWTKQSTWEKANPSLGFTIPLDKMREDCERAQRTPLSIASFQRYRLNIWGTNDDTWLRTTDWDACKKDFVERDLEGRRCYAGLDVSKRHDMTAFVLMFPIMKRNKKTGKKIRKVYILPFFWLPRTTVEAKGPNQVYYEQWEKEGLLRVTESKVLSYSKVLKDIKELKRRFNIVDFCYDPWNAQDFSERIEKRTKIKRYEFPQKMAHFNEPMKEFERLILNRRLCHNGHKILTWQAGNVVARQDKEENIKPVKPERKNPKKIDGIVGAIMGLGRLMQAKKENVYEGRGIRTT